MITPKRFGLKFTPIPTLALEYECEAAEDEDQARPSRSEDEEAVDKAKAVSLYVYRNEANDLRCRKLHVVELPTLTRASEASKIIQQLQADNKKFLAPSIVKESQLRSLLERLIEHLQPPVADTKASDAREPSPATAAAPISEAADHDSEAEEEEESMLEESVLEESVVSLEASKIDAEQSHETDSVLKPEPTKQPGQGTFLSQAADDEQDAEEESTPAAVERPGKMEPPKPATHEDDGHGQKKEDAEEADHSEDEDTAKKAALKSDAEVSDEEDIQSEDLEYFSEDASDEDSF